MTDIHSIKPTIETNILSENQYFFILFLFVLIITIFLSFLLLKLWRKYYPYETLEGYIQKPDSNYDRNSVYISRLNKLKEKINHDQVEDYFFDTTVLVKEFFSEVYNIEITELTSSEVLNLKRLTQKDKDWLSDFLRRVDQSKFAKQNIVIQNAFDIHEFILKKLH